MNRCYSTDAEGYPYDQSMRLRVWEKGTIVSGYNAKEFRKDIYGYWIKFKEYGNIMSGNGWEIDHIKPASQGGSDDIGNLHPLQWKNNRKKADNYPWNVWDC